MATQHVSEQVHRLVAPLLEAAGLELVDVVVAGRVLRVSVDRPGGIDIEAVSEATRLISPALDEAEGELGGLADGRYVLEVSSPGVERPLRTPEHFRRFVGKIVSVKTGANVEGERRTEGILESADDGGVVVAGRRFAYPDIERARTVFVWPEPKQPKRKAGAAR